VRRLDATNHPTDSLAATSRHENSACVCVCICIGTAQGNLVLGQKDTNEAARHIAKVHWRAQQLLTTTYRCVLPPIAAIYALDQPNSR
jgi:hypothetical protein